MIKITDAEILRLAAEDIDEGLRGPYSCNAVHRHERQFRGLLDAWQTPLELRYARAISPDPERDVEPGDFNPAAVRDEDGAIREHRVIALLMAAEMAETGDL